MTTRVKLNPGQKGTKKLVQQFGDALYCVRYRYDPLKQKQLKTVELIVSESDWTPPPAKFSASTLVTLSIKYSEKSLQAQVKSLGGKWDPKQRVWVIPYGCITGTNLEKFIIV